VAITTINFEFVAAAREHALVVVGFRLLGLFITHGGTYLYDGWWALGWTFER
jgi:hypothetical protein